MWPGWGWGWGFKGSSQLSLWLSPVLPRWAPNQATYPGLLEISKAQGMKEGKTPSKLLS